MVCFEKRLGSFGENEKWAKVMIDANKTIFVEGGILKHSLPLFKFIPTPKWKRFLDAEDVFYSYDQKSKSMSTLCFFLDVCSCIILNPLLNKLYILLGLYNERNASKIVEESIQHISSLEAVGQLEEGQYSFLMYLLSREELSLKDVFIITLSLFGDGLSTV